MGKKKIELDDDFLFEDSIEEKSLFDDLDNTISNSEEVEDDIEDKDTETIDKQEKGNNELDIDFTNFKKVENTPKKKGNKKNKNNHIQKLERATKLKFSDEQLEIINHKGTPLCVLSGAGSGKTTILTAKMLYREMVDKVKPINMLAISFTAKATREMEERYHENRRKLSLKGGGYPTFKTFHALFLMLLQSMNKYNNLKVIDSGKMKYALSKHVKQKGDLDKSATLDEMFTYRGLLINKGLSPDGVQYAEVNFDNKYLFDIDNYKYIMEKYKNLKELENSIDFEDMQTLIYKEIFEKGNKKPIEAFHRVWGKGDIYIDEYQDISKIQRMIMEALIKDINRFTVIGDDDQSIYSFRGSDPQFILDFQYTYPNAETLYLSTNYRCKENILKPVLSSIEKNQNRIKKDIKAYNEGGIVDVVTIGSDLTPLVDEIESEVQDYIGDMFSDIAILVRHHSQRAIISDALISRDVPINIKNEKFSIQNNKVYKTILGIIKMIKEKNNDLFIEYSRVLFPHIRKEIVDKYIYEEKNWYFDIVERMFYNVRSRDIKLIKMIKGTNNVFNCIVMVWKMVKGYYKRLSERGFGSYAKTLEIVKYMMGIAKGKTYKQFIKEERKKVSKIRLWVGSNEALKIDTLHSVKGLEFDTVYLIGLNGDVIPNMNRYERYLKEGNREKANDYIEEERRLFYVGWTRAKERLVISYTKNNPSIYIKELEGIKEN